MQVDRKGRPAALCRNCMATEGRVSAAVACDHIIPMSKADADGMIRDAAGALMSVNDTRNLQPLCKACHSSKTEREAAEAQGRRVKRKIGLDGWPVE
jgi:5-methylcytosine-specific restriction enzyme A